VLPEQSVTFKILLAGFAMPVLEAKVSPPAQFIPGNFTLHHRHTSHLYHLNVKTAAEDIFVKEQLKAIFESSDLPADLARRSVHRILRSWMEASLLTCKGDIQRDYSELLRKENGDATAPSILQFESKIVEVLLRCAQFSLREITKDTQDQVLIFADVENILTRVVDQRVRHACTQPNQKPIQKPIQKPSTIARGKILNLPDTAPN